MRTVEPKAYEPMMALEKYIMSTAVSPTHRELIKIRASQINGCAYCINKHAREAREAGETEQRIYALNAWRETPFFTEEERVILALTEAVTLIAQNGVPDDIYHQALSVLGENYMAQVLMAIITINAWNRLGVTQHLMPE